MNPWCVYGEDQSYHPRDTKYFHTKIAALRYALSLGYPMAVEQVKFEDEPQVGPVVHALPGVDGDFPCCGRTVRDPRAKARGDRYSGRPEDVTCGHQP